MKKNQQSLLADLHFDPVIMILFIALILIGLVMVSSSSIEIAQRNHHQAFYYLNRQTIALALGVFIGFIVLLIPVNFWHEYSKLMILVALIFLIMVLIPGIGKVVNGSSRWISFGIFNLQVSEVVKFTFIIYLASYLVRKKTMVQNSHEGFFVPLFTLAIVAFLLLLEPDMGASVVIVITSLSLMLIAGVPLLSFIALSITLTIIGGLLIYLEPYRLERLKTFTDPWHDPFGSGFQLTQSLMAFGRGEWFGVGLGHSLQKQFYLPEAHTDFIFAVMAEELGVFGAIIFLLLIVTLITRIFMIAYKAINQQKLFEAYLLFGFATWIAVQAFINIGVNIGILPTKGLTLPFISYGGSSLIVMCITAALVLRVDYELRSKKTISLMTLFSKQFSNKKNKNEK
ncbi:MAG: putative lipid II flippase FtsW [Gammaproteobacteria bacterium]|nr:putative lipid II flippase FtsW [Gammaproteobacteria bacterium]